MCAIVVSMLLIMCSMCNNKAAFPNNYYPSSFFFFFFFFLFIMVVAAAISQAERREDDEGFCHQSWASNRTLHLDFSLNHLSPQAPHYDPPMARNDTPDLGTRYEDVHLKLQDLRVPNLTPLETETDIPLWATDEREFLRIAGVLHDFLISSQVQNKRIRNAQHASKSFQAALLLFKMRGCPYPLSDPNKLTNNAFNNYNATTILDFLATDVQVQRVYKIRMYNKKQAANNKAATKDTTKRGASQNSADTTGINQDLTRSCLERICAHFRISVKKDKQDEQLSTSEMLDMLQSKVKSLKRKLPSDYFDQSRRLLKRSAQTPEFNECTRFVCTTKNKPQITKQQQRIPRKEEHHKIAQTPQGLIKI